MTQGYGSAFIARSATLTRPRCPDQQFVAKSGEPARPSDHGLADKARHQQRPNTARASAGDEGLSSRRECCERGPACAVFRNGSPRLILSDDAEAGQD